MVTLLDGHSTVYYNHDGVISKAHPSSSTPSALGQVFKVKTVGAKYKLTQFKVHLKKIPPTVGHLKAVLYAKTGTYGTDAKPTGSPLATSETVDIANIGTSYSEVAFNFVGAEQYEVLKDQEYCIAIQGYVDPNIRLKERYESSGSDYHDGNRFNYKSSAWYSYVEYDLCFYVYGELVEPPPPPDYNITVASGSGGHTVPTEGVYEKEHGSTMTLTGVPDDGYVFLKWVRSSDGRVIGANPYVFAVTWSDTYTCYFEGSPPPPPPEALEVVKAIRLTRNLALDLGKVAMKEDFTTYTEVEPDDRIQKTATHIDAILRRDEDAYLYKDKGVNHFGSDWEHFVDVKAVELGTAGDLAIVWALSNYVDDLAYWDANAKSYYVVRFYAGSGAETRLYLSEKNNGDAPTQDYTASVSVGTMYYLRIVKSGISLQVKIYSTSELRDIGGTPDVDTLSLTVTDNAMQYIFAVNTANTGHTYQAEVDVENLNLREVIKPKIVILIG